MPLFGRKDRSLPLRVPRFGGPLWPDRREFARHSFATQTLYQMARREAFEPQAHAVVDLLVDSVLPLFPLDVAPQDAPYLRQVLLAAAQVGAGIGLVEARTADPGEQSIDRDIGGALWEAASELPALPPEQRRLALYLLQSGHYLARTGPESLPLMLAALGGDRHR
jgi:hypothetical protein